MKCKYCDIDKKDKDFPQKNGKRVGFMCKKCCYKRQRANTLANPERTKEYHRKFREKNRESLNKKALERYHNDIGESRAKSREKYRRLRPEIRARENARDRLRSKTLDGVYRGYKKNAKTKKIDFTLTKDFFKTHWQDNCFYCGETLERVGFDRVDNLVGYIVGNVVPCCPDCNWMKGTMAQKSFITKCVQIADNLAEDSYEPYFGWCDVAGCELEGCSGGNAWRESGYWTVCYKHADDYRNGKPQPEMKQSAIDKENSRDPVTGYLPSPNEEDYRLGGEYVPTI